MNQEAIRKDWVGQVVGERFRLVEWVASAGRSGVFRCEVDGDAEHKAAIKLFPAEAAGAEACAAGWATAVELSHPHLIGTFFTGRDRIDETNILYVVTEYAGEVLSEILPERHLSPEETKEMLGPVLDALGFLHANGLVHGRVKPSNIMVVDDQLKLSEENFRGVAGTGTPPPVLDIYDAPERAQGQLLPASDMWSLGVTLVETLTQIPPVWNRTAGTEPIVPPSVPKPFAQIAGECMRLDPALRCTREEVEACLENGTALPHRMPETARTPIVLDALGEPSPQPQPKSRRGVVIGAAAAVLVVVFAIVMVSTHHPAAPTEQQTSSAPATDSPESAPQTESTTTTAPQTAGQTAPGASQPAQQTAQATPVTQAPTPAPEKHAARKVEGAAKGSVAQQVMPDVPQKAGRTITGTVKVGIDVNVDASGAVTDASIASQGPSKYFANLALKAANGWKFAPAQVNGQSVASEWRLEFRFRHNGTEVTPREETP
jgi:eukaryotic-like serine/threonine-protein kinase